MQISDITDSLGITSIGSKQPEPPRDHSFDPKTQGERELLHSWEAPTRSEIKSFGGKLTKNILIVAGVLGIFLLVIGEFMIILVVASIAFIAYILANTPPESGSYELSTHGIKYLGKFYYWNQLGEFFFTEEGEFTILNVNVEGNELPARLFLTLNEGDKEKVKDICSKYLSYLESPPENPFDKTLRKAIDKLDL